MSAHIFPSMGRRLFAGLVTYAFAALLWMPGGPLLMSAQAQQPEITISSASWGIGKKRADVTATVTVLLFSAEKSFAVNYKTLKADPAPGTNKFLDITYKFRGEQKKYTIASGKILTYQKLLNHAMGLPEDGGPPAAKGNSQILTSEEMVGIVMIEGDKGVGTGFISKVNDIECVVTNLHVLGDNEKFTIRNLAGEVIPVSVQGISGATSADIALLRLSAPTGKPLALELADDVLKTAKISNQIVVVGNRLGGGVATQTVGSIKGIGPARIEVDAAFQSGNSGSPIYDVASKKVIGVAAFTQTVPVGRLFTSTGSTFKIETRWFGYRLDSVTKWEPIEWPKWRSQIQRIGDYRKTSLAVLGVLQGNMGAAKDEPGLKKITDKYEETVTKATKQKDARAMLSQVKAYAEQTAKGLDGVEFYDYFRTCPYWETNAPHQTEFRERIIKELGDIDARLELFLKRQ